MLWMFGLGTTVHDFCQASTRKKIIDTNQNDTSVCQSWEWVARLCRRICMESSRKTTRSATLSSINFRIQVEHGSCKEASNQSTMSSRRSRCTYQAPVTSSLSKLFKCHIISTKHHIPRFIHQATDKQAITTYRSVILPFCASKILWWNHQLIVLISRNHFPLYSEVIP